MYKTRSICWWVSVTITSVCQWHNGKCVYVSVSECVCVIPVDLFQVEFRSGYLFSPHHVNQGGVQKDTPKVTLYETHTTEESLSRRRSGRYSQVLADLDGSSEGILARAVSTTSDCLCQGAPAALSCRHLADQELNTILRHPSVLDFTNEILCLTVWFLQEVLTSSRDLRLLTHRLPKVTRILGHLDLFACFTLSHTPFRSLCRHQNSLPTFFVLRTRGEETRSRFLRQKKSIFFQVSLFFWGFFFLVF